MSKKLVDPQSLPYRPCVGVTVFNKQGLVWAGHRLMEPDSESLGTDRLWQMPQGGIDKGEDPEPAAFRELYEETGISSVRLLGSTSDWLTYDLPAHLIGIALKGRFRGQRQKWFAFRFEGDDSEIAINPPPGGHTAEFDQWAWKPLTEMVELVVPFKQPIYRTVAAEFERFTRG
ncbi:RNA pyrophosphohydrolase [Limoniibacter endophyticus]|uniref:RNA pyrophosphohydrolase n=1 Tax=Limoniibacter endophyticus TaxID=1565040 RepID=A0A8J3GIR1_9HYPH|nr:RNA pyrophosphohydrolase [Limoniibacter endophyticus]GHC73802.1 RNA pyrophosphohydrolase [Limoniibacter endophyticus]